MVKHPMLLICSVSVVFCDSVNCASLRLRRGVMIGAISWLERARIRHCSDKEIKSTMRAVANWYSIVTGGT
jgi:hypothetical protein